MTFKCGRCGFEGQRREDIVDHLKKKHAIVYWFDRDIEEVAEA